MGHNEYEMKAIRLRNKHSPPKRSLPSFHSRYDALEQRRCALHERLSFLPEKARAHPSYKRTFMLLNQTFRKSSLAQRGAVLSAANWSIDLLEQLTLFL